MQLYVQQKALCMYLRYLQHHNEVCARLVTKFKLIRVWVVKCVIIQDLN